MPPYFYLFIAGGILFGIWLVWFLKKRKAEWRASMDALHERHGWAIDDITPSSLGSASKFGVHDPKADWEVTSIVRPQTQGSSGSQIQFTCPMPAASGAMALLGPPMPTEQLGFMSSMMGSFVTTFLAKMAGLPPEELEGMRQIECSEPVTLIASNGAEPWINPGILAPDLGPWLQQFPKLHPIVILGGGQLRVRVRGQIAKPAHVEAFIQMTFNIRQTLHQDLENSPENNHEGRP